MSSTYLLNSKFNYRDKYDKYDKYDKKHNLAYMYLVQSNILEQIINASGFKIYPEKIDKVKYDSHKKICSTGNMIKK